MTDGNGRQKGTWKEFLGFLVRLVGFFLLLMVFGYAMFWARRNWVHH